MAKFVKCDCGVTVRNDDIDALVAEVQQHPVGNLRQYASLYEVY